LCIKLVSIKKSKQQGLQPWLHQPPTATLIRLVCTAWHHMGSHHHPTNRPSKWTLYIQGREETHHLKMKFAVNLCQLLSVKNDRGHCLLSDRSHQKPVWLTSLPTDYWLQIHTQLAYNRMGPISEWGQSKAEYRSLQSPWCWSYLKNFTTSILATPTFSKSTYVKPYKSL